MSLNQASILILYILELKVKFDYKYNYKRALYKDSRVIQSQYSLIGNIKAIYSVLEYNSIYNSNKIGFIIGLVSSREVIIATNLLTQLKLIQPSNREQVIITQGIKVTKQIVLPFIIFKLRCYPYYQLKEDTLPLGQSFSKSYNSQISNKLSFTQCRYFNRYIRTRTISAYYILIINSYKSYNTIEFY